MGAGHSDQAGVMCKEGSTSRARYRDVTPARHVPPDVTRRNRREFATAILQPGRAVDRVGSHEWPVSPTNPFVDMRAIIRSRIGAVKVGPERLAD
jgi:hypothetical protein